ncbi:MAG: metal-dependent phosphohydrolase [Phycisphaerae bacterium]
MHDAIHEPGRADNEARSAALVEVFGAALAMSDTAMTRVRGLILATAHAGSFVAPDATLIADIDLAILAAGSAAYEQYRAGIRSEYAFAPEAAFRAGRIAFIESMLGRESIYHTPPFVHDKEQAARANPTHELSELRIAPNA